MTITDRSATRPWADAVAAVLHEFERQIAAWPALAQPELETPLPNDAVPRGEA